MDVEDGKQAGDVEGLLDARALVEGVQGRAQVPGRLEPGHQLAQARAVHEGDLREVEQDLLPVLAQELVDGLAQDLVAQARAELAAAIELYRAMEMPFWLERAEIALVQERERGK